MKKLVLLCAAVFTLGLALPVQAQNNVRQENALFYAVSENNLTEAKRLIKEGADINKINENGYEAPLHEAVLSSNLEMVKLLIDNGADVNIKNDIGRTPIFYINSLYGTQNRVNVAKILIDNGANIYILDKDNETPFHLLSFPYSDDEIENNRRKEYFNFLFSLTKDVDLKGIAPFSPLHTAVGNNDKRAITFLLSKGADINVKDSNGFTPINYAEDKEMIDFLITKGAKVDNLFSAVVSGDFELVKTFIANGTDVNVKGNNNNTPLILAVMNNQDKIAKYLISKGADIKIINDNGLTPLHYAAEKNNLKMAKFLVEKGADVNAFVDGNSPLSMAVWKGNYKIAKYLISKGADVNFVFDNREALLWIAAYRNDAKMVELLMKNGADINKITNLASTPIEAAILFCYDCPLKNKEKILKTMLKYGADIDMKNPYEPKWTALDAAIFHNRLEEAKLLFKLGAKLENSLFKNLNLITAIGHENKEMIELLLDNGADINAKNENGKTALDRLENGEIQSWGKVIKNEEIRQLLISHGAKSGKDLK